METDSLVSKKRPAKRAKTVKETPEPAPIASAEATRQDHRNREMSFAQFPGQDLSGSNFEGTKLRRANFKGSRLHGVNFAGANLQEADFENASLSGANLVNALVRDARFVGVNGLSEEARQALEKRGAIVLSEVAAR